MLQATKNLTKFVQTMKPNNEATIRLEATTSGKVDCLFYLHKGNGRSIFAKLIVCPTIDVNDRGEYFLDLFGTFDGYAVNITFAKERNSNDLVTLERHDPKAGYPELAKCYTHWNYMTPEEWEKFIENAGGHAEAKRKMEQNESGNGKFGSLISGAFAWDETKEGGNYWIDIYYRTEPIV